VAHYKQCTSANSLLLDFGCAKYLVGYMRVNNSFMCIYKLDKLMYSKSVTPLLKTFVRTNQKTKKCLIFYA
jgi:hypothetical protein